MSVGAIGKTSIKEIAFKRIIELRDYISRLAKRIFKWYPKGGHNGFRTTA